MRLALVREAKVLGLKLRQSYARLTPWQKVLVARHPERPHCRDYIAGLIGEFVPLAGDRSFAEEPDPEPLARGRRVRHPRYGYGVILAQEGSGEETRLTVYFDRAGKKKFVARYADLTPA